MIQMLLLSFFVKKVLHSKKALKIKEGNKYNKEASFIFLCGKYLLRYLFAVLRVFFPLPVSAGN